MNKEQFIELGLSEDLAEKAAAASADELKGFVPKARFDEVNEAKKQAEKGITDRDKQIEELGKTAGLGEDLKKQIDTLQAENKTAKEKYEADLKELRLDTALKLALGGQVHDPEYAISKLDKTKIELNEDGTVKAGLEEQVKGLRESKAFLFVPEDKGKGAEPFQFRGVKPVESGGTEGSGGSNDKSVDFGKRVADYAKQNATTSDAQKNYFGE